MSCRLSKKCLVWWCTNREGSPGLHFFNLTSCRRETWLRAMGREGEMLTKNNVVCSMHFRDSDLITIGKRTSIKKGAVPIIVKPREANLSLVSQKNYEIDLSLSNEFPQPQSINLKKKSSENTLEGVGILDASEPSGSNFKSCSLCDVTNIPNRRKRRHAFSQQVSESEMTSTIDSNDGLPKRVKMPAKLYHVYIKYPVTRRKLLNSATNNKKIFQRKIKPSKQRMNCLETRITLKDVIREVKKKNLVAGHALDMSPSIIRNRMSNFACEPGFSEPVANAIKSKVECDIQNGRPTICCLMLDEMAIKKQIDHFNGRSWGYVDVGTRTYASQALVLMVVSVNSHWKTPIAYYFIHLMTAAEKTHVVKHAVMKLDELGVIVASVTYDGPSAHFKMMEVLGGINEVSRVKPYFKHPEKEQNVYVIFDASHMLKLMRNNWATLKQIKDKDDKVIDFKYIEKLHELQEKKGFLFGIKLKLKRNEQKNKLNLAAQTLSGSVADALEFLMNDVKDIFFRDAEATIQFIRTMDKLFKLCNSRNPSGRGYETPLKTNNEVYWKPILKEAIHYLQSLKNINNVPLHLTRNKTPIMGFIITALSLMGIYEDYVKTDIIKYFLTHKVSQDHLELFFLNIRLSNGWNNNPTAYEFYHFYKRCIVVHDIGKEQGNCTSLDETSILTITGGPKSNTDR